MIADMKMVGHEVVVQVFADLPHKLTDAIRKRGMRRAAAPILNAARAIARAEAYDTGTFTQAHGVKVKHYKQSDHVIGVIGARRGPKYKGRANIAHLIESGWTPKGGGEGGEVSTMRVGGKRIMGRAWASKATESRRILIDEVEREVMAAIKLMGGLA